MKHVTVTGEFVNLVPAHDRYIAKSGEGSTWPIAIGRAVDKIFDDKRVKGKRHNGPFIFKCFNADHSAAD